MKQTAKAKKKPSLSKAKKKAWTQFSVYVRTRDCIRFCNSLDEGKCVTCGRIFPFKSLQAGHFIPGRTNAVLFDERLVFTQCMACNVFLGGNYIEYFVFMESEWGRAKIDEFRALKHQTVRYSVADFERLEADYKARTAQLVESFHDK